MSPNRTAFLTMISHSEGTDRAPDPYRVCFGYKHTIADLAEHPAISGEWHGAQYRNSFSTAAGRYQIIRATWISCRDVLTLPDFGPVSQDAAAILLIDRRHAMEAIDAGDLSAAIALCHEEWASLPGSTSGQPQKTLAQLTASYVGAGGTFA